MALLKKIRHYVPDIGLNLSFAFLLILGSSAVLIWEYWNIYRFLEKILSVRAPTGLTPLAAGIFLCAVAYTLIYFIALMTTHHIAFRLEASLKKAGMDALLDAPASFYDKYPSGKLRKLLDDNTALTHSSVAHLLPDLAAAFFTPLLGLILAFRIDWRLFVFMILTIVIGALIGKNLMGESAFMSEYMQAQEEMGAHAVEYVRNMGVVKIFNADIKSMKNFHQSIVNYADKVLKYTLSCRLPYVVFQTFFNSVYLLVIPLGYYFLAHGEKPFSYLTKVIFYVLFCVIIFVAFMKIMYVGMHTYLASSSIEKIEKLIEEMQEGRMKEGTIEKPGHFAIDFSNVSFAYEEEPVFEGLNLHLDGGKFYALVGSSGGGKSTLAKLVAGFYTPGKGEIRIGGHPLKAYTDEARNAMVAMVFQNAKLFNTTILENVQIGNPEASREEALRALSLAQCGDILDKFAKREDTLIGSKGVYLSGGEKQRIAIARAILKDAPIIILDEASAAADPENEYEIRRAFNNLMKGKTVMMIAHRLTGMQAVDEILVVDGGKIIERGTHEELMEKKGRYAYLQNLYKESNDWRVA